MYGQLSLDLAETRPIPAPVEHWGGFETSFVVTITDCFHVFKCVCGQR